MLTEAMDVKNRLVMLKKSTSDKHKVLFLLPPNIEYSDFVDPLDMVDLEAAQFGSYKELIQLKKFRFNEDRKLPLVQS